LSDFDLPPPIFFRSGRADLAFLVVAFFRTVFSAADHAENAHECDRKKTLRLVSFKFGLLLLIRREEGLS
jgi:hypothetical protein